ncbi:hypothetical protein [Thiolapillus sp.]
MKNSLHKTARWSALAVAMGVMSTLSVQGQAAINWPGATGDPNEPSKSYKEGYKVGQEDCVGTPKDCGVLLEDVVAMPGWGETEPNDHLAVADRLHLGRFYQGNSLDKFDQDWYFIDTGKPNQNLLISFLGDQANYTDTEGWIVEIRDQHGNIIAAFGSTTSGPGNVYRNGDKETDVVDPSEPILAKTPLSNAKIILATLGNAGRYYISVASMEDKGEQRTYHIAAMISESDQIAPNPDSNFFDTETEINDTQDAADPIRSNVHMFGAFGRKMVKWFTPAQPAEYELEYFYKLCNPMNVSTMPVGLDTCECDITNNPVTPYNPNIDTVDNHPGIQPGPLPPDEACEAKNVLVPGTGTDQGSWNYAYDYDNDWFVYRSEGNEQLHFEMCTKGNCDFARVHLRIIYVNDSVVLVNGPIQPGWSYDFGAVGPGTYFFELSPEPVDGPQVDPDTGVHTVDDLTGPYNFLLRSTKLPPHGN